MDQPQTHEDFIEAIIRLLRESEQFPILLLIEHPAKGLFIANNHPSDAVFYGMLDEARIVRTYDFTKRLEAGRMATENQPQFQIIETKNTRPN